MAIAGSGQPSKPAASPAPRPVHTVAEAVTVLRELRALLPKSERVDLPLISPSEKQAVPRRGSLGATVKSLVQYESTLKQAWSKTDKGKDVKEALHAAIHAANQVRGKLVNDIVKLLPHVDATGTNADDAARWTKQASEMLDQVTRDLSGLGDLLHKTAMMLRDMAPKTSTETGPRPVAVDPGCDPRPGSINTSPGSPIPHGAARDIDELVSRTMDPEFDEALDNYRKKGGNTSVGSSDDVVRLVDDVYTRELWSNLSIRANQHPTFPDIARFLYHRTNTLAQIAVSHPDFDDDDWGKKGLEYRGLNDTTRSLVVRTLGDHNGYRGPDRESRIVDDLASRLIEIYDQGQ